jgi:hypothetical protein
MLKPYLRYIIDGSDTRFEVGYYKRKYFFIKKHFKVQTFTISRATHNDCAQKATEWFEAHKNLLPEKLNRYA